MFLIRFIALLQLFPSEIVYAVLAVDNKSKFYILFCIYQITFHPAIFILCPLLENVNKNCLKNIKNLNREKR